MWWDRQPRLGERQRTHSDQLFAASINGEIRPFKAARTDQQQVALLSEYDFIDRECLLDADDRKPTLRVMRRRLSITNSTSFLSRAIPIFLRVSAGTDMYSLPMSTSTRGSVT